MTAEIALGIFAIVFTAVILTGAAVAYRAGGKNERQKSELDTLREIGRINSESRKTGIILDADLDERRRAVREWLRAPVPPDQGGGAS